MFQTTEQKSRGGSIPAVFIDPVGGEGSPEGGSWGKLVLLLSLLCGRLGHACACSAHPCVQRWRLPTSPNILQSMAHGPQFFTSRRLFRGHQRGTSFEQKRLAVWPHAGSCMKLGARNSWPTTWGTAAKQKCSTRLATLVPCPPKV